MSCMSWGERSGAIFTNTGGFLSHCRASRSLSTCFNNKQLGSPTYTLIHNIKSAVSHVIWVYFLIRHSCEGQDITAALCCLPLLVSGNSLADTYSTIVLYLLLWHPPFLSAINKVSYFLSYPIKCTVLYYFICHMQLYIVQCTVKCILYTCISRKREREKNTVVKQRKHWLCSDDVILSNYVGVRLSMHLWCVCVCVCVQGI